MRIESKQLFEQLEPPAGGLERLRQKLTDRDLDRSGYRWQPAMAAAMVVVALAFSTDWLLQRQPPRPVTSELLNATALDRLLGRPPVTVELLVLRGEKALSMVEVPGTGENVRIYRLKTGS